MYSYLQAGMQCVIAKCCSDNLCTSIVWKTLRRSTALLFFDFSCLVFGFHGWFCSCQTEQEKHDGSYCGCCSLCSYGYHGFYEHVTCIA